MCLDSNINMVAKPEKQIVNIGKVSVNRFASGHIPNTATRNVLPVFWPVMNMWTAHDWWQANPLGKDRVDLACIT